MNKNKMKTFLTALATVIKKDPTTSIRKHTNELKVNEKTVRTAIKQNQSPDFGLLDYAIWGVLEKNNKKTKNKKTKQKTKQMLLPIQILVHVRLLLRKNGIKCVKNLF